MSDDLNLSPKAAAPAFRLRRSCPGHTSTSPTGHHADADGAVGPVEPVTTRPDEPERRREMDRSGKGESRQRHDHARGTSAAVRCPRRDAGAARAQDPIRRRQTLFWMSNTSPWRNRKSFYSVQLSRDTVADPLTKEQQQFDTLACGSRVDAEFPVSTTKLLSPRFQKVAQQTKAMSPDQPIPRAPSASDLNASYRAELEDKLNAARRMVAELDKKTPGLKKLPRSRGLGDNVEIASLSIHQAERYSACA